MSNTLMEVFAHVVFSFTRGVTEHFNPEEPEFTLESFGCDPLQSTGREWNYHPVDELIYQEYSDRENTSLNYPVANSLNVRVIDACSPDENEETQEDQQHEDRAMAWKRLRPSALRTVCKSMYIGAFISLLTATIIGSVYMLISYLCYKTINNCQFHPKESIPVNVQWLRSISDVICCAFLYTSTLVVTLFLFRPYQLMGLKRKLILVCCLGYCLDALYRVILQALGISQSKLSTLQKIPLNVFSVVSVGWQDYLLTNHFCTLWSKRRRLTFFLQITVPAFSVVILAIPVAEIIYPVYNKQSKEGKLLIALFSPLTGVVLKVISRICVELLSQTFAIHTLVQLVIEWFFTSVSLAIETHYQNMAVMAVWRRRWKRHISVAVVTAGSVRLV
ncbi:hypothetical protein ACROYT_G037816 [Oculina patagonica]